MSNEDSFISEVTEEVRRDRLFALMRRYGWLAVLLVVLLVGGAAWNEWRKASAQAAAEASGDVLIGALNESTPETRLDALNAVDLPEDEGKRAIVRFLQAAAATEAGDHEAARGLLAEIAADADVSPVYRDLAVLKSAMAGAGSMAPEDRIAMLEPISQPGNPFRLLAIEQSALAEIERGNSETALETLQGILADSDVTEDLRRRASQLIVALGGTVEQG